MFSENDISNPIMEELYSIRRKISERYGHDINRYIEALRAKEQKDEAAGIFHRYANLPIARVAPAMI